MKEEKSYGHLDALMESILEQKRSKGAKRKKEKKSTAKNIACKEKPEKQAAIKAHISRFHSETFIILKLQPLIFCGKCFTLML